MLRGNRGNTLSPPLHHLARIHTHTQFSSVHPCKAHTLRHRTQRVWIISVKAGFIISHTMSTGLRTPARAAHIHGSDDEFPEMSFCYRGTPQRKCSFGSCLQSFPLPKCPPPPPPTHTQNHKVFVSERGRRYLHRKTQWESLTAGLPPQLVCADFEESSDRGRGEVS